MSQQKIVIDDQHTVIEQLDKDLIKQIINKEAELKKIDLDIENSKRQIAHIQRSKTWKFAQPFLKLKRLFTRLFSSENKREQAAHIQRLEKQINSLETELDKTKEQLEKSLLDDRNLNSQQIIELIRQKKSDGNLINYMENAIIEKNKHVNNYNEALIYAARLFMNEDPDQRNVVYDKVLSTLNAEEIPEFMIRAGLAEDQLQLRHVSSFRGSLSKRVRQKQFFDRLPEYALENKIEAYRFIDELGVRRPDLTEGEFSIENVPKKEGTVIKPVNGAGSRGVYLIYTLDDIIDIKRSRKLTSILELEENMQKDLTLGWVHEDQWMVEEFILEDKVEKRPASDIKFYCFYGKVGLILEISRYPERKHCWWTSTGERIRTGKYEEDIFKGKGVTNEELELAQRISLKIPAPFIRIDFLRSEEGLVFGEFTAKPGNYDEFDDPTDQWLGDYYIEAEGKLVHDLLANKQFTEYKNFIEDQTKLLEKQN